ncbi:hypothetical protein [Nonomuraea sp. NPDC050202]|uniref:hypothetical protein n=1 Tax=Nonomuraea sp. NPDC050202 TaxID=3155035 RepID=UPI0033F8E45B
MGAKWSVIPLIEDHLATFRDQRTNEKRNRDYLVFYAVPMSFGIACYLAGFEMRDPASILAGIAVFTALLFGLLLHVFSLGLRIKDDPRQSTVGRTAQLVDQLQANVGYAVLVGIVTTALLIIAAATTGKDQPIGVLMSAVIAGSLLHLMLTVFMALKRTRAAYHELRF